MTKKKNWHRLLRFSIARKWKIYWSEDSFTISLSASMEVSVSLLPNFFRIWTHISEMRHLRRNYRLVRFRPHGLRHKNQHFERMEELFHTWRVYVRGWLFDINSRTSFKVGISVKKSYERPNLISYDGVNIAERPATSIVSQIWW